MIDGLLDDGPMREAAILHVRRLLEVHGHLSSDHLKAGFAFQGERIPLVNPQRGIFKPRRMSFLLAMTV